MNISSDHTDRRASDGQRLDITRTLSPVARAIGLGRMARGALLGFAAGAIVGAGLLFADRVHAYGWAVPAAVVAVVLGLLAGAAVGAARWPGTLEAARAADLYFQLDDRLTTALELRTADTPVAFLQSRDVAHRIDGLKLSYSHGRWFRPRDGVPAAVAVVALSAALTLGLQNGPHRAAIAAASNTARVQHNAANRVKQLTSQLHLGLTPAQLQSPAVRRLNHVLAQLRSQLLHSSSPRGALRAISATQQQIRRLALGLHPVNARAVAQLNSSLSRYLGKGQTRSSSGTSRRSSAAASANAMSRLAQSLQHLTPSQRAALARALARAANSGSNTALRSALRQAASALANSNPQAAATTLQQAAQSLSQTASAQAALSRTNAAGTQLGALKNQIAGTGAAPRSLSAAAARSLARAAAGGKGTNGQALGQGKGTGKGKGTGTGKGKGKGTGTGQGLQAGQGRGAGRRGTGTGRAGGRGQGRAAGQGTAATTGRGTSGARGAGGTGRSGLTRAGRNVTVFVPGKQGKGAEIVRTGPQGAPLQGNLVPYQQVVQQYAASAHQALDRSALPPSLQGDVRRYFSTLSR